MQNTRDLGRAHELTGRRCMGPSRQLPPNIVGPVTGRGIPLHVIVEELGGFERVARREQSRARLGQRLPRCRLSPQHGVKPILNDHGVPIL
jgi:hypothetical protein